MLKYTITNTKTFEFAPYARKSIKNTVPEITSLQLPSDDKRYHWNEHFETCGTSFVQGLTCIYEPKASEPSNLYEWDLFSLSHLLIVSCMEKMKLLEEEEVHLCIRLSRQLIKQVKQDITNLFLKLNWKYRFFLNLIP